MVLHFAGGVIRALLVIAGVLARVPDTGLVAGAPLVLQADGDRGVAAVNAHAHGLVVQHLALFAVGAGPGVVARALAAAVVAGLVGRAVLVLATLNLTGGTGQGSSLVDDEAELAAAAGLVVAHHALLVKLAGEAGAGVVAGT